MQLIAGDPRQIKGHTGTKILEYFFKIKADRITTGTNVRTDRGEEIRGRNTAFFGKHLDCARDNPFCQSAPSRMDDTYSTPAFISKKDRDAISGKYCQWHVRQHRYQPVSPCYFLSLKRTIDESNPIAMYLLGSCQ
jgi:hypothetical protein